MKHVLVLLLIILALIPAVFAEDDKWIDGIRFRLGLVRDPTVIYMPWKIESRIPLFQIGQVPKPYDEGALIADVTEKDIYPIAIELPETLMTSWSFRGGLFEFKLPTEMKDLNPNLGHVVISEEGWLRQRSSYRTSLYNDFFNDSDKAFADANPNWAMSADFKSSRIFLGYTLGFFIPIGENNRFFKVGAGLGIYYLDISLKMNLCSAFKRTSTGRWTIGDFNKGALLSGECFGKTEIDSYSVSKLGISSAAQMTVWEKRTKDSIWRLMSFSVGIARNSIDNGYIPAKLKNHRSLDLWMGSESLEIVSYTYRF